MQAAGGARIIEENGLSSERGGRAWRTAIEERCRSLIRITYVLGATRSL